MVKKSLTLALKFLALVILYFLSFAIIAALLLPSPPETSPAGEPLSALSGLLLVSLLNTAVLIYATLHARWSGIKLVLALGLVLFGVTTLMPQIETAVFVRTLPQGFLFRLFLTGFLFSTVFSTLLVLVLGKSQQINSARTISTLNFSRVIPMIAVAALIYAILYFTFGYFIAWQSPAVRAYYHGGEPGGFVNQLITNWQTMPWLFPFQFLRGLIWSGLALVLVMMITGSWWKKAIVTALIFSVVMNSQLLLPNPLMPFPVRVMHLIETASSNFLFGWLAVWLLKDIHANAD